MANSFGKIVLKSFDPDSVENQTVLTEFNDLASFKESCLDEFSLVNPTSSHYESSLPKTRFSKWTSNDNMFDSIDSAAGHRSLNSRLNDTSMAPKRNKSLFTRAPPNLRPYTSQYKTEYLDLKKNEAEKKEEEFVINEPEVVKETEVVKNDSEAKKEVEPARKLEYTAYQYQPYVYPVKLTLKRNQSVKSDNGSPGTRNEESGYQSPLLQRTTFKQQLLNQGPKLVNF